MNFKLIFNQLGSLYRWGRLCSLSVSALYHKNYNNILENHDLHVRFEWGMQMMSVVYRMSFLVCRSIVSNRDL